MEEIAEEEIDEVRGGGGIQVLRNAFFLEI